MLVSYEFRPAIRENTPLVIGLAGPTKSGKTFSAHRLAIGLANGGEVVMLNAEGQKGHQYAERFRYTACDLVPPYRYPMYEDVFRAALARKPGVIIIDSMSHAHDGPGGFLEWHEAEIDRMAGKDASYKERDKCNFTAWIKPKAAENSFRYALLEAPCPVILCMRAKEKLKLVTGKPPVNLGWQPIVGEGLAYETIFTLVLPPWPHPRGVPDLSLSDMREPFDAMIPAKPIDEELGRTLREWAAGAAKLKAAEPLTPPPAPDADAMRAATLTAIEAERATIRPSAGGWAKVVAYFCAAGDLDRADISELDDLLTFARALVAKNPEAQATLDARILKRSAA